MKYNFTSEQLKEIKSRDKELIIDNIENEWLVGKIYEKSYGSGHVYYIIDPYLGTICIFNPYTNETSFNGKLVNYCKML